MSAALPIIWIERTWSRDGFYLRMDESERFPAGKAVALHKYNGLDDPVSQEEVAGILSTWGIKFDGANWRDEGDKVYVTIAVVP